MKEPGGHPWAADTRRCPLAGCPDGVEPVRWSGLDGHSTPPQVLVALQLPPGLSAHDLPVLCPCRLVYPKLFSQCSEQDMWQFLGDPRTSCLLNAPRADELYGGPVCGNQFVERGEQCDCGTPEVGTLSKGWEGGWAAGTLCSWCFCRKVTGGGCSCVPHFVSLAVVLA